MRYQLPFTLRSSLSFALLLIPAAACTNDSGGSDDDAATVASSLELENGGFDTADEAPQFGEETLFAAADIEADASVTDPFAVDPTVTQIEVSASAAVRDMIVLWGRMPADPTGAVRDWSGTLRVSRGAVVIRRKIAFELATDRILPRTSRDAIQFESQTSVHADGLVLTVLDPTPADPTPLALTYVSADGATTYSLDVATLSGGPVTVDAGDGNQIAAIGHLRTAGACDHGFLRGRWRALTPNAGVYAGLVVGTNGAVAGHVRGIYGHRQNGDAVFFGKFIDLDGHFRGILGGTYDTGHFGGRWLDRSGDHGAVRGMYRAGETMRAGQFLGRWAEASCAQQ
jgi:hypothetical protein